MRARADLVYAEHLPRGDAWSMARMGHRGTGRDRSGGDRPGQVLAKVAGTAQTARYLPAARLLTSLLLKYAVVQAAGVISTRRSTGDSIPGVTILDGFTPLRFAERIQPPPRSA